MSTPKDIIQEIKLVLEADTVLKGYIQKFYLGIREGIPQQDFPVIMIEPASNTETQLMTDRIENTLRVTIIAYTRAYDLDVQLEGDSNYKGITDLELDIKKALDAKWPTLNDKALIFNYTRSEFAISENPTDFPVRGVFMDLDIRFRTTLTTRT